MKNIQDDFPRITRPVRLLHRAMRISSWICVPLIAIPFVFLGSLFGPVGMFAGLIIGGLLGAFFAEVVAAVLVWMVYVLSLLDRLVENDRNVSDSIGEHLTPED